MVRQLLAGLPADKFQQSLLHGGEGDLTLWCRENDIPEARVPTTSVTSALFGIGSVVRAFRRFAPDIAILHGQWGGPIGVIAAGWAGVPASIYIAHCPAFYHSTTLFRAVRNHIAEHIPCSRCDRIVTLSDGNHYNYLYRGWAPEKNLIKIHNGVDPSDLPSVDSVDDLRKKFSFQPGGRHAVFVGRIDDQKRVDWLLHSWRHASPRPDWHLWIVGDGKERSTCERLASELGLRVSFVGNQPHAMDWIAASDLLVLSSLYEGHALVPLEAMASSKPVVSFATDGVTDSVIHEETGLLAPLGDTVVLGSHIARLLANPEESRRMGEAGNQRLRSTFPLSKTIHAYQDLLESLPLGGPTSV